MKPIRKFCRRCRRLRAVVSNKRCIQWSPNAAQSNGLQSYCRECMRELARQARGPEAWRQEASRKHQRIYKAQRRTALKSAGQCIICGCPAAPFVTCLRHRKVERVRNKRRVRLRWIAINGDPVKLRNLEHFLLRKHVPGAETHRSRRRRPGGV